MLIQLVAHGQPVSAKNHKRAFVHAKELANGKKHHYATVLLSEAIIAWYKAQVPELERQFERIGMQTITSPVEVHTHQFLQDDPFGDNSPDGDNVQSAAFDALVKAKVLRDDKLVITGGFTRQRDSKNPRVEIEVRTLNIDDVVAGWR